MALKKMKNNIDQVLDSAEKKAERKKEKDSSLVNDFISHMFFMIKVLI